MKPNIVSRKCRKLMSCAGFSVQCVGTLGTTPTCAFDKLLEIGPICEYNSRLLTVFFTARCTIVQSAVLQSHVACPSVCPSVTLVDDDHIG